MSTKATRRPVRNFLLKKSLQIRITATVIFLVFVTSGLTTLILSVIYNAKSRDGSFFYMSNDITQNLELTSILGIILPALITAQLVSLLLAVAIGLFSSRKVAVPVYKLERWAAQLKNGKLNTQLGFRETGTMKDLTVQCNALAGTYRQIFSDIDALLKSMEEKNRESRLIDDEVRQLKEILQGLDY